MGTLDFVSALDSVLAAVRADGRTPALVRVRPAPYRRLLTVYRRPSRDDPGWASPTDYRGCPWITSRTRRTS